VFYLINAGAGSNPDGDGAKPEKQSNELSKKTGAY